MTASSFDKRTLTELDHARIARLVGAPGASLPARPNGPMADLLDAADLVPSVAVRLQPEARGDCTA